MGTSFHQRFEIAQLVRSRGTTSRLDISTATGVALPTISTLIRDLMRRGVISEDGYGESAGGRKPARLRINPDFAMALGAEVSTRRVAVMLVDVNGGIRAQEASELPSVHDQDHVLNTLLDMLAKLLDGTSSLPLRGIGIGISGILDTGGRVSRELPQAEGWKNVPLAEIVEQRFRHPTRLLQLVHASTLGEIRFGGWEALRDMVYLHVGRGISVGLVSEGSLCRGATGNAGEFGHSVVRDDAPLCYCGNRGCLESLASPQAIVGQCREGLAKGVRSSLSSIDPEELDLDRVLAAATGGDKLATNAIEEAGAYIGGALANLVNVLNPAVLMLGGRLAHNADVLTGSILRAFRARVLPALRDTMRVEVSALQQDACAMGAAASVFDELFKSPESLLGTPKRRGRNRSKKEGVA